MPRLCDMMIAARGHRVTRLTGSCDCNDADVPAPRLPPHSAAYLVAIQAGHANVQENYIGPLGGRDAKPIFAVVNQRVVTLPRRLSNWRATCEREPRIPPARACSTFYPRAVVLLLGRGLFRMSLAG